VGIELFSSNFLAALGQVMKMSSFRGNELLIPLNGYCFGAFITKLGAHDWSLTQTEMLSIAVRLSNVDSYLTNDSQLK
jgi:hypothetical protein